MNSLVVNMTYFEKNVLKSLSKFDHTFGSKGEIPQWNGGNFIYFIQTKLIFNL